MSYIRYYLKYKKNESSTLTFVNNHFVIYYFYYFIFILFIIISFIELIFYFNEIKFVIIVSHSELQFQQNVVYNLDIGK